MTVRGSSTSFDSRASRARLDRAFLGFLIVGWPSAFSTAPKRELRQTLREAYLGSEVAVRVQLSSVAE
jgi:hypothetical protein